MKRLITACAGHNRRAIATLTLLGAVLLPASASAQGCRGGVLSTSPGNIVGSAVGGAAGGFIGNQFGRGSGKEVLTGVGVVGGALAGGYVARSVEGCGNPAPRAAAPGRHRASRAGDATEARTCRFVATQAVIEGREQPVDGVACLEADGNWKVASGAAAQQAAEADLVLRAQQRLHEQGFYVRDNIDGRWGPATSSAVRNFQRASGLASTGQLDGATQRALQLDPAPLDAVATVPSGAALQAGAPRPAPLPAATAGSTAPPAEAR